MKPDASRKRGNLTLVPVHRTPEEWLDLEFREAIAALPVARGRTRPARFYRIAAGERHPLRVPARVVRDALAARVPADLVLGAITRVLRRYAARAQRMPLPLTGDFPRVA